MGKRRGEINQGNFNAFGSKGWKNNVQLLALGSNFFVQDFWCLTMRLELVGQNRGLTDWLVARL